MSSVGGISVGKFGDEHLFRRVAHLRRVVDHQRLRMDALEQMGGGDVGQIERRVLAQQHHVEFGERRPLGRRRA